MTESILDRIVAKKMEEISAMPDRVDTVPCQQDFDRIFHPRPGLIAEIKAASPSEGDIAQNFDPVSIAADYVRGGANALSVLTDAAFFKGSFDILRAVRATTDVPILCKDFILSERQIRMARASGADMGLLIVKILTPDRLIALKQAMEGLGMQAVIEVQNKSELETALSVDPDILLINHRDLTDFTVDHNLSNTLAPLIPENVRVIGASGISKPADLVSFSDRIDGFLIGTALMRSADKAGFLKGCRDVKN